MSAAGLMRILSVAAGGAVGALLRYGLSEVVQRVSRSLFPWGTLAVNLSGSLLIGFFVSMFARFVAAPNLRRFLLIGLLGSYTTFSTLMFETVGLLRDNEYGAAAINILVSNLLGVALVLLGFWVAELIVGRIR